MSVRGCDSEQVYHALVWIQGKTMRRYTVARSTVYHALVWIQGKTLGVDVRKRPGVYHALVWIQGKTELGSAIVVM